MALAENRRYLIHDMNRIFYTDENTPLESAEFVRAQELKPLTLS